MHTAFLPTDRLPDLPPGAYLDFIPTSFLPSKQSAYSPGVFDLTMTLVWPGRLQQYYLLPLFQIWLFFHPPSQHHGDHCLPSSAVHSEHQIDLKRADFWLFPFPDLGFILSMYLPYDAHYIDQLLNQLSAFYTLVLISFNYYAFSQIFKTPEVIIPL